jgi:hypothetical protein
VGTDWAEVTVPLSSFQKDPYYTDPTAILGHPMDLTKTSGMNFQPNLAGANTLWVGPVETSGSVQASSTGAAASSTTSTSQAVASGSTVSSGASIQVLDCTGIANDGKNGGTFQDSQGSTITFNTVNNPVKPGSQYLLVSYTLSKGGYCGMWLRAGGSDWNGVDLSKSTQISLSVYSKDSVVLGLTLKDKNNNQYVAQTPPTKGGKWEMVTVSMDSFKLDPYYTPPDAVKGAPKDFSKVATFNFQPQTEGKVTFAVNNVTAQ